MKLYHGSNQEICTIDLSKCRPYKDFGRGFYLTTMQDQAIKMAKRVARIYGGSPVVNVYEFDENCLQGELTVKFFDKPDIDWAVFILNNRSRSFSDFESPECNHDNKYDLVIGPVANDDLALLFRQFESGLISVETLVAGMKYKKLTNQYSFHTEKALQYLKKEGIINV